MFSILKIAFFVEDGKETNLFLSLKNSLKQLRQPTVFVLGLVLNKPLLLQAKHIQYKVKMQDT